MAWLSAQMNPYFLHPWVTFSVNSWMMYVATLQQLETYLHGLNKESSF
jgi:hypothetical protein